MIIQIHFTLSKKKKIKNELLNSFKNRTQIHTDADREIIFYTICTRQHINDACRIQRKK